MTLRSRTRLAVILLLVPATVALLSEAPSFEEWSRPETATRHLEAYENALASRADAHRFRQEMRQVAELVDDVWKQGDHRADVALVRGRAHYFAGELPRAVLALREGLAITPYDAELQRDLALCRDHVRYPELSEVRIRPAPLTALEHRMGPFDLFALTLLFSFVTAAGAFRRLTISTWWATPVFALGLGGMLLVVLLGQQVADATARARGEPFRIVRDDATLRRGNGPLYPARLDTKLPRGAEVRELMRKGNWVQIEVNGGAVGWLPERFLLFPSSTLVEGDKTATREE